MKTVPIARTIPCLIQETDHFALGDGHRNVASDAARCHGPCERDVDDQLRCELCRVGSSEGNNRHESDIGSLATFSIGRFRRLFFPCPHRTCH